MTRPAIRLPIGVRDFLPRAAARRRALAARLHAVFDAWGFERIITPMFECADVLELGLGGDAQAAAIRFIEPQSGEVVALRPDITPQVARLAATRLGEVPGPLRLSYEGLVTRLDPGPRTQREILQAGVELIDAPSPEGDAELLSVAAAALATTEVPERRLDIGHVALARWALDAVDSDEGRRVIAARLAKKDAAGVAAAAAAFAVPARVARVLEALPTLYGDPAPVLRRARELRVPAAVRRSFDETEEVISLARLSMERDTHRRLTLDFGEVRGFEYYTGMRVTGYVGGAGEAVLRGGRYDELVGRYGRAARATGFAVDVEAIAVAEVDCGVALPVRPPPVLVAPARPGDRDAAMSLAAGLRRAGMRVAFDPVRRSQADRREYARKQDFLAILLVDGGELRALSGESRDAVTLSAAAMRRAIRGNASSIEEALEELGGVPVVPAPPDSSMRFQARRDD